MNGLIDHRVLEDVEKPERVVIMLHGIGQHSGYMDVAGRAFIEKMPNTLVVMPEAPIRMRYSAEKIARIHEKYDAEFDATKARSWFNTATLLWPLLALKIAFNKMAVVNDVNKLADHYRDKYGLGDRDIAFFGMSQGGAIATYAAIARKTAPAAVVNHSGMFFGFARAKSKPDVLLITGDNDDYLCNNKSFLKSFFVSPANSMRRLLRRGIGATEVRLPDLGHEMNAESVALAAGYLAKAFGQAADFELPPKRETALIKPMKYNR